MLFNRVVTETTAMQSLYLWSLICRKLEVCSVTALLEKQHSTNSTGFRNMSEKTQIITALVQKLVIEIKTTTSSQSCIFAKTFPSTDAS